MADRFRRSRRGGAKRTPARSRRRRPEREYEDEWEDAWEDEDDHDEPEERPRRSRRSGTRRSRRPAGRGRGERAAFDWSVADADEDDRRDDRYDDEDYEDDRPTRRRSRGRGGRRPARGRPRERRKSLMDLCTPVFGYAALLPREADDPALAGAAASSGGEPAYDTFRQQVVSAIRQIVDEAPDHGIERQDAEEASYALALFIDEAVAGSGWSGKSRWSGEPLHITMHGDPEGGIHFYERLERLGDRQKDVRAVYLVCLALGFRGKYIEMEATQQVARIGEVKEKALRQINRVPIERRDMLFPEAYREAAPIEDEVPAAPRWWLIASLSTLGLCLILYLVLFVAAGRQPRRPLEDLNEQLQQIGETPSTPVSAAPGSSAGDEQEERP